MFTLNPLALRAVVRQTRAQIVKAWESAPKSVTNTGFHDQSVRKFMSRIPIANDWTEVPVPLFDLVCLLSCVDPNMCHARGRQVSKGADGAETVVHEDLGGEIVAELQRQLPESFPVSVSVGGSSPKRATAGVLKSGVDLSAFFPQTA